MNVSFCLKFRGNLAAVLGEKYCLQLSECLPIHAVVDKVLRSFNIPTNLEDITLVTSDGRLVDESKNVCEVSEVFVVKVYRGG
ncbi:MAG: hypothetical protein B7O98_04460 [Zestosphaera tikiterensis]|uniref:Ubiquitin Mut7-C domain-containing protein n=1 Tax=Zestosphaera tikiterensis TaxID=1973259 RepID=A0A2R7Y802_9CREN|nr:MAG: hypothetical protein B7O98_04460 [Zestosphaera tikiterensis]